MNPPEGRTTDGFKSCRGAEKEIANRRYLDLWVDKSVSMADESLIALRSWGLWSVVYEGNAASLRQRTSTQRNGFEVLFHVRQTLTVIHHLLKSVAGAASFPPVGAVRLGKSFLAFDHQISWATRTWIARPYVDRKRLPGCSVLVHQGGRKSV